ncbi:Trs120-domain-containing protein [Xylariaceae sp. FL0804]|nr:Trs120-domain-containing protein [Xylariaceae sp. FL0804]
MSLDSMLAVAPARVRALVLPIGQIKRDRFSSFLERLSQEHVVQLRDISADGRPNRNMFSPLAFPGGAMFYDMVTYVPPPSHLALSPFDLFREPLAVIAIADGEELERVAFSKRQSASHAPTMTERNIRTLYQDLEELRDTYPKMLTHQVLVFDYTPPADHHVPMPEGVTPIPTPEHSTRTTMKTVMCDMASLLLAEMTTLAKSFEGMTAIDSPGQAPTRPGLNGSWTSEDANPTARRNSQFALSAVTRSASTSGAVDRHQARMSMPISLKAASSSDSTPTGRPTTPVRSGLSNPPTTFDDIAHANGPYSNVSSPERKGSSRPETAEGVKSSKQDKVAVQGFGPGGRNERWRNRGKGRATIMVGSLYLQAGRWPDALKELVEGATVAKSINDHLWHGKALELITTCLLLLGWAGIEFQVPVICYAQPEKTPSSVSKAPSVEKTDSEQPRYLQTLQAVLPDLFERIVGLYSRMTGEQLPPLPFSESIIRFCTALTSLHICDGKLDKRCLNIIVLGRSPTKVLSSSPRLAIEPSRSQITSLLFKAFPAATPELLTTVDRSVILSGIATVLGTLGFHRKKAMVVRELVSVLIAGLVEARTRGAAEVGIHPAAGLVALNAVNGHGNGAGALELGEGDIEHGIDAFLGALCRIYGVVDFQGPNKAPLADGSASSDTDASVIARIQSQSSARHFGMQNAKLNILRACINFSEALPDFGGVLKFSSDLLRTAGSGVAPGPRREDAAPIITREEQVRLSTNISKTSNLSQRLGLGHLAAEYWDEFLVRGVTLDPLAATRTPISHSKAVLPGATTARTSQDVNPFIYNPFSRAAAKVVEKMLVTGEMAQFRVVLQNPFDIDVEIESIKLDATGVEFESPAISTVIGPYRTQILKMGGTPKAAGSLQVTGAIVRVRGCRERRFPIFSEPWAPDTDIKVKGIGLAGLDQDNSKNQPKGPPLKPDSISLNVIPPQPILVIKSTSLSQSSVMVLAGERQAFSVTLHNVSQTTPADLMLFSFQDSTQNPLQSALANRDATPAELYEYELVLAKKQALRHRKVDEAQRFIPPGGTATFEFEILGKPGLTNGTIQIDYGYLGVPQSEIDTQFHTRQVCLDLTVTVNASIELARLDVLPIHSHVSRLVWGRLGGEDAGTTGATAESSSSDPDGHCLLLMDLHNAWPSDMEVCLRAGSGATDDARGGATTTATEIREHILPGNTNRVLLPLPRIHLENPHAFIPSLNPHRQRQFVVSTGKITPEIERANREAFWYREKMLELLSATWKMTGAGGAGATKGGGAGGSAQQQRQGTVELRGVRLTPRMIEAVKVDEVGIEISVEGSGSSSSRATTTAPSSSNASSVNVLYVDEFARIRVAVTNRTAEPIRPTIRVLPALRHQPQQHQPFPLHHHQHHRQQTGGGLTTTATTMNTTTTTSLDLTRRLAWNGTLQQTLARPVEARGGRAVLELGVTALCRGEFEVGVSVEETALWTDTDTDKTMANKKKDIGSSSKGEGGESSSGKGRQRSDTHQAMMDAVLGPRERRVWHSRRPCVVVVRDRDRDRGGG